MRFVINTIFLSVPFNVDSQLGLRNGTVGFHPRVKSGKHYFGLVSMQKKGFLGGGNSSAVLDKVG